LYTKIVFFKIIESISDQDINHTNALHNSQSLIRSVALSKKKNSDPKKGKHQLKKRCIAKNRQEKIRNAFFDTCSKKMSMPKKYANPAKDQIYNWQCILAKKRPRNEPEKCSNANLSIIVIDFFVKKKIIYFSVGGKVRVIHLWIMSG